MKWVLSTEHLIKSLDDLRSQAVLCDVHLVAEGAKFPAHRVVLAAGSPYFQAMFTGGFKENQMNEITLNDTSSEGLKCVLDAIYTGKLSLSEENVCNVLPVASLLQLDNIVDCCEGFFIRHVSAQRCLSFLCLAEKYDLQKAVNKCNKFVLNNFDVVPQTVEFKNLSKELLCTYLSKNKLKTSHGEIVVYRAALRWYEANYSTKNNDHSSGLAGLMQHVRFPLIPSKLLLDEILTCPLITANSEVMRMVTEALQFQSNDDIFLQPLQKGKQFQPRGEKMLALIQSTFKCEGQSFTSVKTKLYMIKEFDGKPFQTQFSEQALAIALCPGSLSLVAKGNYLFMFGADVKYCRATAVRFDVKTNTWLDLKPPPCRASGGTAATVLKGNIYLLGGMHLIKDSESTINPSNFVASVSQYSIETNSWSQLEDLPRPCAFHAAASHGNYVFCAGGFSVDRNSTDKLYAFDVVGSIWLSKASMNNKRAKFSMETVGAKLVACGGLPSPNVEIYDIADDQWTLIQDGILEHHDFPSTVVLNDKVYVIGGSAKDRNNAAMTYTNCVSCVDVGKATVRRESSLPFRVANHACAVLTVPHTCT